MKANAVSQPVNILFHLIFIVLCLVCIVPLILLVVVSLTGNDEVVRNGYRFWPERFSLDAYRYLFIQQSVIVRAYLNTIFVTVVGTVASLLVVSLYAYPISRPDFRYKGTFTFLAFFTLLFSGGLVPFYMVVTQVLDLKNTLAALILPYCFNAFNVLILRTYFATSVPFAVIESAKLDGAGEFRVFFTMVMRLSLPGLATIGLFTTILYWNDYYLPLLFITEDKNITVQYLMYRVQAQINYLAQASSLVVQSNLAVRPPSESARMALAVVGIGPIVLAYPFFQKYFVQGLTLGSVKG